MHDGYTILLKEPVFPEDKGISGILSGHKYVNNL